MQTIAEQGIRGLFKGMGAPLATVAIFNAVLFTSRGQMEQLLAHSDGTSFALHTAHSIVLLPWLLNKDHNLSTVRSIAETKRGP